MSCRLAEAVAAPDSTDDPSGVFVHSVLADGGWSLDYALRETIRGVIRDEVPAIVREELKALDERVNTRVNAHASELMKVPEVAAYLKVDPKTVYAWVKEGRLRKVNAGHAVRVRRADVEAFLADQDVDGDESISCEEQAERILDCQSRRTR
ncbi:MAG: helix-turn-helix domain-containing protein [Pseudomonadota bacterium]